MTIRRFVTGQADPYERGVELGRYGAEPIRANLTGYERLFRAVGVDAAAMREFGTQACTALEAWSPSLYAELRGLAGGAELPVWRLGMLNARTEILAAVGATGEGECSMSAYLPAAGAPRTVQTWDWHDELDSDNLVARHPVAGGRTVRYFTEFGMLGKIGVNGDGLGLHFNILSHASDADAVAVPVHAVARAILDGASTVAEAVEIAGSAEVSASTVLTVVTYDGVHGDAVCIELSPERTALVRPDDGLLVHTNHFLDGDLAHGDLTVADASTYRRRKQLLARRDLLAEPDPLRRAQALALHEVDGAPVCCHPDPAQPFEHRWQSLLTVVLDLERSWLQFHDGGPCGAVPDTWQAF